MIKYEYVRVNYEICCLVDFGVFCCCVMGRCDWIWCFIECVVDCLWWFEYVCFYFWLWIYLDFFVWWVCCRWNDIYMCLLLVFGVWFIMCFVFVWFLFGIDRCFG